METIGQRIARLRIAKGWSRPELGRQMAQAIGRKDAFSGEMVRLYEADKNRPGVEARSALAKVFNRSENYIEFGAGPELQERSGSLVVRGPDATYDAQIKTGEQSVGQADAEKLLVLIQTFLDTDALGRKQLLKAATSVLKAAHGATAAQPRRAKRR